MQFGDWKVLEFVGNRKYLCECSCGAKKEVQDYKLTHGLSTSCGHGRNTFIDLTGQHFGDWEVLEYEGKHLWKCRCSCGKIGSVASNALRTGKSQSCGHNTTGFKDLKGQKFGEWTAIEYAGHNLWKCRCSCGTEELVRTTDLLRGKTKSCGHDTTKLIDIKGQKFGELVVEEYLGDQMWLCRCSCGNTAVVKSDRLRCGRTRSCGCKTIENAIKTNMERYGVPYVGQKHRTAEEVTCTVDREHLLKCIKDNFNYKPTTKQLCKVVNLQQSRLLVLIHEFGLEDFIDMEKPVSSYEDEINDLFPCNDRSNRTVLLGKELDLYYSDAKLAVEFNGSYWHSTIYKDKNYHQQKVVDCAKLGIQLISIFEYEWLNDDTKQKIIKLLDYKINKQNVNFSNLTIREIGIDEANQFLAENCIGNYKINNINIGCYSNETLVGLLSAEKKADEFYDISIVLINNIENTKIDNALFGYFIDKYNTWTVTTSVDISKFTGNNYLRLGFRVKEITEPSLIQLESSKSTEESTDITVDAIEIYDCGSLKLQWFKMKTSRKRGR
jgi:hypothetical protein